MPRAFDDHAIKFVRRGFPLLEPSFAALEPMIGSRAWGVCVGERTPSARYARLLLRGAEHHASWAVRLKELL